jgi:hypothetical protein
MAVRARIGPYCRRTTVDRAPRGNLVNAKKIGIIVGVAFALFFVISQPQNSADLVLNILTILGDAAASVVAFIQALF